MLWLYLNATTLLAFLSFNVFVSIDEHSVKIKVCWRVVDCDSRLESQLAKFFWLKLWLSLWPKQLTQTDSNSSLNSDSTALPCSGAAREGTGSTCPHHMLGSPKRQHVNTFSAKFYKKKCFIIFAKWSDQNPWRKLKWGALGCLGPFGCILFFFCKILPIFPFLQNEVNEIPGENWNWGPWEVRGPSGWHAPHPIVNVWLCHWYPVMCH